MFSVGLLIGKRSFQERGNTWIKLPFSEHIANKFRKPTILQLNIEGLTLQARSTLFITSVCSLRHSSSYYRRPTALQMQRSWYFQLPTSWVFFKQEAWSCHIYPRANTRSGGYWVRRMRQLPQDPPLKNSTNSFILLQMFFRDRSEVGTKRRDTRSIRGEDPFLFSEITMIMEKKKRQDQSLFLV